MADLDELLNNDAAVLELDSLTNLEFESLSNNINVNFNNSYLDGLLINKNNNISESTLVTPKKLHKSNSNVSIGWKEDTVDYKYTTTNSNEIHNSTLSVVDQNQPRNSISHGVDFWNVSNTKRNSLVKQEGNRDENGNEDKNENVDDIVNYEYDTNLSKSLNYFYFNSENLSNSALFSESPVPVQEQSLLGNFQPTIKYSNSISPYPTSNIFIQDNNSNTTMNPNDISIRKNSKNSYDQEFLTNNERRPSTLINATPVLAKSIDPSQNFIAKRNSIHTSIKQSASSKDKLPFVKRNSISPQIIYSDKPFKCNKCEKKFKRSEHLKRHIRSVHSTERPYHCQFCEKNFSRSDNLSQHLKTHKRHGDF
ncbi:hypothetical protein TPHA_0C02580 [Tetrapisispora phaffii CBS 4417]|uniref:C2H2-type domain-containing protein n=1 Tax=Tetrapisispora phaffii (strain ATCC 24235 / CBS 4417 / NBRC 1672 / NRRL Y-8282 / UCD 70-5) TaxID=1071381 RepID=G8BRN5_TETPH|nr:hypothetical protein TPHA_0C02580 [Tetrapisispora phaffii CBS 4417]CCE62411.1 hypothetical protein TPHA_0C02580 [Tetrapisispora phaffii CBS 4417]